jgi:signal transduction histidine kinase
MSAPAAPAVLTRLYRDRLFRTVAGIAVAGPLLRLVPGLPSRVVLILNDDVLLLALAGLTAAGLWREGRRTAEEERFFWRLLAAGYAGWFLAEVLEVLLPAIKEPGTLGLVSDVLYLAVYTAFYLALNAAPHRNAGWTHRHPGYRLEQAGALLFTLGLAGYLVLVPFLTQHPNSIRRVYETGLFVAYDLVLTGRLLWLVSGARPGVWRWRYGALAATTALWAVGDVANTAMSAGRLPDLTGFWYDLLWYVMFLPPFAAMAIALTPRDKDVGEASLERLQHAEGLGFSESALWLYPLAVMGLHLCASAAGLLAPESEQLSTRYVLGLTLLLTVLALLSQVRLERRLRELSAQLWRTRRSLLDLEKQQAIGRLAGGLAHRMNNLLTVILGHADLLTQRHPGGGAGGRHVTHIQDAAWRAARLTSDLLAVGQQVVLHTRPVVLSDLLRAVLPAKSGKPCPQLVVKLAAPPSALVVDADLEQLGQAVGRLLAVVCAATPSDQDVTLELNTEWVGDADDWTASIPQGRYAMLSIEHGGAGLNAADCRRVFDPFLRYPDLRSSAGEEFGLAVPYGIVCQHHGHIRVTSEVGRGTRFDLLLPLAYANA